MDGYTDGVSYVYHKDIGKYTGWLYGGCSVLRCNKCDKCNIKIKENEKLSM